MLKCRFPALKYGLRLKLSNTLHVIVEVMQAQCNDGSKVAGHSGIRQSTGWSKDFNISKFYYHIELQFPASNNDYKQSGKMHNLSNTAKGAVLKKLCPGRV